MSYLWRDFYNAVFKTKQTFIAPRSAPPSPSKKKKIYVRECKVYTTAIFAFTQYEARYLYDALFNMKDNSMIHGALIAHAQYAAWFTAYHVGSLADNRTGNVALKDEFHNT
jgi:hypothetical protein